MARYIDADKLIEEMQDCKYANPCNDYQRGVNASIDIQITGIKHIPAADVAPRAEVEKLQEAYNNRLAKDIQTHADFVKYAKAEVAREIFEEIENDYADFLFDGYRNIIVLTEKDYTKLKKKYTEEKK